MARTVGIEQEKPQYAQKHTEYAAEQQCLRVYQAGARPVSGTFALGDLGLGSYSQKTEYPEHAREHRRADTESRQRRCSQARHENRVD